MTKTMSPRELIGKTFKHLRTGGLYRVITTGVHVDTKEVLVTYVALKDGVMWVRSYLEFVDGRFEEQA